MSYLLKKAGVCAIFIFFVLTFPALAEIAAVEIERRENPEILTWREAAGLALHYNPDLQAARADIRSSAGTRDIAFGGYLPSVSGELERSRINPQSSEARDSFGLGITADTLLFSGFTTTGNVIAANKLLQSARFNYYDASAGVRFRLRSSFVELLRLEKQLEVNSRISARRQKNADLIQLRYEAGREHLGSALRAQAIADQAGLEVKQTARRMESEALRLGREAGGQFELPLKAEGDLEKMAPALTENTPDFAALAEKIPGVESAVKTAEAAKANILSVQGRVWPQISGSADYGYSGRDGNDLKNESSIGVRMSVPFFEGGKNIAAIRRAKADYDAAQALAKSARDEAIADLSGAWTQLMNAAETVEVRKRFLEAARKRSEIVRTEYEAGLVNFQDFDISEQEIADAERNYVDSLAAVLTQQANWELNQGRTLEDVAHEK